MPTTYAHDLFGKLVYPVLPLGMRRVIRRNGDLFRIGLHGPDCLFYNLPRMKVIGCGVRMHAEPAREFFERGLNLAAETGNRPLLAYLLGFGCHFILDTYSHGYVYEISEQGLVTHTLVEKELDRTLMLEQGRNPFRYYPADGINPKLLYAAVMHKAIPEVSVPDLHASVRMQKLITNAFVYDNRGRRRALMRFLTMAGGPRRSDLVVEYFMAKECPAGYEEPVAELHRCYDRALLAAPGLLEELWGYYLRKEPLSEIWDRNYNGQGPAL